MQIFVRGRGVGGCDDLLAAIADGSFQQLLEQPQQGQQAHHQAAVPATLLEAIAAARQRVRRVVSGWFGHIHKGRAAAAHIPWRVVR